MILKTPSVFSKVNLGLILGIIVTLISTLVVIGSIKGNLGNPNITELNSPKWMADGPLELSPDRGRYALLYSVAEQNTVHFSLEVAKFAMPDLGYNDGKFVSLFAPGLSFILVPGYWIGKYFGSAQVGAFGIIAICAILNFILIAQIAIKLGAKHSAAYLGALAFLFGTNAYAYSVSLYQHHISTFLILALFYAILKFKPIIYLPLIWFVCAASVSIDYPNFFMLIPFGIYGLTKLINISIANKKLKFTLFPIRWLSLLFLIPPIIAFAEFNRVSYGNPLTLAGSVEQVKALDANNMPVKDVKLDSNTSDRDVVAFFATRKMLNGFYILFFSPDRGLLQYAPIVVFGTLGFFFIKRNEIKYIMAGVISMNIILYSMWGDPWGGWAFGPRYLIPIFAVLSILIGMLLTKAPKKTLILLIFIPVFAFSVYINTIGALTSNANPPQVEVLKLEELSGHEEKYTYGRNIDELNANDSKAFIFKEFIKGKYSAWQYTHLMQTAIGVCAILCVIGLVLSKKEETYERH
ncbi:MAG: hypothetical protein E6Q58_04840 [Niabella sp.]|nr:MAG: hypothetical protein E6Q58_04840 [Niabella sp.]